MIMHRALVPLALLLIPAALPGIEAYAACGNDCPEMCRKLRAGPPIEASFSQDPLYVCKEAQNPSGSETWNAEDWYGYFNLTTGVALGYSDTDQYEHHWWRPGFADPNPDCQTWCRGSYTDPNHDDHGCNCTCICWEYSLNWADMGGGPLHVTWQGTVDLTVEGTYTLTATICEEDSLYIPNACAPYDEVTLWVKDSCITKTLTIHVTRCCNCEDCPGSESDWQELPRRDCRPSDDWEQDPIVDSCGNKLQLTCKGAPDAAYHLMYEDSEVGTCIFKCGGNSFLYKRFTTACGWRISAVFHRTIDYTPWSNPSCDRGTCDMYDWLDTFYYPCLVGPPAPPECCAGGAFPWGDPDADCPSPGICVNNVPTCP